MAKSLQDLSPRAQFVVFVVLSALVAAAAWQVLLAPEMSELSARQARLDAVKADVSKASATAHQLPVMQREVAALEEALLRTTAVLPIEKDSQDVLRDLHDLASESSLEISTFTPKPTTTKAQYAEWPIELGLEGTYHDLARFFDRIAGQTRLMSITDVRIKVQAAPPTPGRPNARRGTITASCLATTFVFRQPGAPDPVPAKGKS